MISCRQLTRRFNAVTAVDSLSFEVAKGTICALLGPNGAGKSTTVKMLCGLLVPTSGRAEVCGLDVAKDAFAVKQRIGVLPENLGLFDDLTLEEHLLLTAGIYGLDKEEARSRIDQLLRVLGLADARRTFAAQGSHGMRKKISLAMALLPNPAVLFLDEPFEGIDPATSKVMRDMLISAAGRGVTVFITAHILPVVERIAGQFIIIRGGKLVWNSTASELSRPLEDLYLELAEPPVVEEMEWLADPRDSAQSSKRS